LERLYGHKNSEKMAFPADREPVTDHVAFIRAQTKIGAAPLVPELTLHLASEVTPLWHATEASLARDQLPPPYWAFAWPGGQALARYLLDRPEIVRGKRALDLGAGCGIGAIAAAKAGAAAAVAAEIDPFAIAAIGLNAALNGVAIEIRAGDLLDDSALSGAAFDLILVGDMCYEQPLADRLIQWLRERIAHGATVLLGDPGRAYLPKAGMIFLEKYPVPTSLDLEDRTVRETSVWRLTP
jgi:predicted nicotinamide N-methyase